MFAALSFLTILGRGRTPRPAALPYFPVVGALLGLAVGYLWLAAQQLWSPLLAAAAVLAVDAALTGLLHLDGLADAADGLIAPMDRARRLTAMRDSSVGAFGVVTLIVVLLLRFSAFASMHASPLAIAGLWCLSRAAMALTAMSLRYARPEGGLASAFLRRPGAADAATPPAGTRRLPRARAIAITAGLGAGIAVPLTAWDVGWWSCVVIGAALVGAVAVAAVGRARIGGFTGDTLGATGVMAETAGLIALAAVGTP